MATQKQHEKQHLKAGKQEEQNKLLRRFPLEYEKTPQDSKAVWLVDVLTRI